MLAQSKQQADYEYAAQLVRTYFSMLTVGCPSVGTCSNPYCHSNAAFSSPRSPTEAAILAIHLATKKPQPLCIPLVTVEVVSKPAEEERPEVDEEDDEEELVGLEDIHDAVLAAAGCSPRRRLSNAMELDLAINIPGSAEEREQVAQPRSKAGLKRRTSLQKQKLLDAIRQSNVSPHQSRRELPVVKKN